MDDLNARAIRAGLRGLAVLAILIFLPAGTLHYWQGWALLITFTVASTALTVYMAVYDKKLLERRLRAGPSAETRTSQKIIIVLVMLGSIAFLVFPVFDHRFGWSPVPPYVAIAGDVLIVLGFLFIFFVVRENSYAASTIQVAEDQRVISTGPYGLVRHPMYAGALVLILGLPLALDSWYGLLGFFGFLPVLVWRLSDEERFLTRNLPGYAEYKSKVRWRLIPGLF
jgi:protein-S-isoprenylcysteine O-methyltransferase Ste14